MTHEENQHGVLVKWCDSFLVATTRKNIVADRKSAVFFVYDSCWVAVSSVAKKASFAEVAGPRALFLEGGLYCLECKDGLVVVV